MRPIENLTYESKYKVLRSVSSTPKEINTKVPESKTIQSVLGTKASKVLCFILP